ncbi:MAG: DUF4435 domain-containing protein [Actinobacteria bacterium]|nr:DUF4435 domain-containing protein [Actinomycetota bacterium]
MLLRAAHPGPIVLVEGPSDKTVLERFVADGVGFIVCYGKPLLLGAIQLINTLGGVGFVGVVDRDHDELLGRPLSHPDVIAWDHTDLETTVLCSPALDRYVSHTCSLDKVSSFLEDSPHVSIREALLDGAAEMGALRLLSERDGLNLPFDQVDLSRHLDTPRLRFKIDGAAGAVLQAARGSQAGLPYLVERVREVRSRTGDPRRVVNGHDASLVLTASLKRVLASYGNEAPSTRFVEGSLLAAFTLEDFTATAMYFALTHWQTVNPGYKLLPDPTS